MFHPPEAPALCAWSVREFPRTLDVESRTARLPSPRNFRVLVVPLKKTFSAEVKGLDGAVAGDVRWEGNL
jgi:hypothetical protein